MGLTPSRLVNSREGIDILACQVWGPAWANHQVICHCDSQSVVADLWFTTSKHKGMITCCGPWCSLKPNIGALLPQYNIDSKSNSLADALSCNNVLSFLSKVPIAKEHPHQSLSNCWIISSTCPGSSGTVPDLHSLNLFRNGFAEVYFCPRLSQLH